MKKSIEKLATKAVGNTKVIKGGGFGSGTKNAATGTSAKPELL